jgi:hypothetical protein
MEAGNTLRQINPADAAGTVFTGGIAAFVYIFGLDPCGATRPT